MDLSWPAAAANEHDDRTGCANDDGRRADHRDDDINGIDNWALQQIQERARCCRILGGSIENDVQKDVENKTRHRCQEQEHELLCGSPGVDECKDKHSRRKKGQQYAGRIIVDACSNCVTCQGF